MKIIIITLVTLLLVACCHADDNKVTVSLSDGGYSTSGGGDRPEVIRVEIQKGFDQKSLPIDDKIMALQAKLHFYELFKKYQLDPNKEINAVYAGKPLKDVLAELLPAVPVKFDGVDDGVTIDSMAIAKTSLETVCEHLDEAAGVFFRFTEQGITVTTKPETK